MNRVPSTVYRAHRRLFCEAAKLEAVSYTHLLCGRIAGVGAFKNPDTLRRHLRYLHYYAGIANDSGAIPRRGDN